MLHIVAEDLWDVEKLCSIWFTCVLGPLGCEMVMKPVEVADGWMRMVLLPSARLRTAWTRPSGFTTVRSDGDTCTTGATVMKHHQDLLVAERTASSAASTGRHLRQI